MSPEEQFAEGVSLADRGEIGAAIDALEKAVELNPENAAACKLLAKLSIKISEVRAFVNWCHEACRIDPDDPEPHYMMAGAFEAAGRLEEAQEARLAAKRRQS